MNNAINISIIFLIFCSGYSSYGQKVCITNTKQNTLYIGVSNPLQVMIEDVNCDEFQLITDNGSISGDSCFFIIVPSKLGRANISVIKITNNDTTILDNKIFAVNGLPTPTAYFAGKYKGEISGNVAAAQKGVFAQINGMDINPTIKIKEFTVVIIKDQKSAFVKEVIGNKITDELKKQFYKLESGDILIFMEIYASIGYEKMKKINSINFNIE